jgi:hypothetical protein
MVVRIIERKWNDESKEPQLVQYFNVNFPGTRKEAHKAARERYPLPTFTLGRIWNED